MFLTNEQIFKAASGSPAPTPGLEIARLVQAGADTAIDALATTPDEEMVAKLAQILFGRQYSKGYWDSGCMGVGAKVKWIFDAEFILKSLAPIYAAREQKAVEAAVKAVKQLTYGAMPRETQWS